MPWKPFACVALIGCSFSADYKGGLFKCSDGVCPTGLFCFQDFCIDGDGGVPDVPTAELNCSSPGIVSDMASDTTVGRMNNVTGMCAGTIQNGPDAVYLVDVAAGGHLTLTVDGSYPVDAYVISPCREVPETPACIDDVMATPGNPVTVNIVQSGGAFIVVDGINPALSGTYTLGVTLQ